MKGNKELFEGIHTATTISFYMVSPVVVGILLGRFVDSYFGVQPLATIAGIIVGMVTGIWGLYIKVMGGNGK